MLIIEILSQQFIHTGWLSCWWSWAQETLLIGKQWAKKMHSSVKITTYCITISNFVNYNFFFCPHPELTLNVPKTSKRSYFRLKNVLWNYLIKKKERKSTVLKVPSSSEKTMWIKCNQKNLKWNSENCHLGWTLRLLKVTQAPQKAVSF